jgi:hypothetical protein
MIDENHLELYLTRVSRQFESHEVHAILMRFMCDCLVVVQQHLPEVAKSALNLARKFWFNKEGVGDDLLAARIDCWRYLDEKKRSIDIQDQEDFAMRAVICVLYDEPESEDFTAETVRWFSTLLNRLDPPSDKIELMMDGLSG